MPAAILVSIATTIITILLKFVEKNSDALTTKLFGRLGAFICAKAGKSAAIIISTEPDAIVEFDKIESDKEHTHAEVLRKVVSKEGTVTYNVDLCHGDKIHVKVQKEGYKEEEMIVEIDNEFVVYCITISLTKL